MKHPQPGDVAHATLYWYWDVKSATFIAFTWKAASDADLVLTGESIAQFTVPKGFNYTQTATAELQAAREKVIAEFTAKLKGIDTALANLQAITMEAKS